MPTIPHLRRSSLHRCLQRHGISRLAEVEGDKPVKKTFKIYPIGYFYIDIAEVQTAEGKLYLYVAIDRTSKFAFVQIVRKTGRTSASAFLTALINAVPYKDPHGSYRLPKGDAARQRHPIHLPASGCPRPDRLLHDAHVRHALPRERDRALAHQGQAPTARSNA